MRLRTRFALYFIAVFGLLTVALAVLQVFWVDRLIINQTTNRMKRYIRSAWNVVQRHEDRLGMLVTLLAENDVFSAFNPDDRAGMRQFLHNEAQRWRLDFLNILDPAGFVLCRSGTEYAGDRMAIPGLEMLKDSMQPLQGFMVLSKEHLVLEGAELEARCRINGQPSDAMTLFAAHVVRGPDNALRGIVVAGMALNHADYLVDEVQQMLFEDRFYGGKRAGTATLFLGPTRIATTVLQPDGTRAVGTRISDEVGEQTLGKGDPWSGRAWVVNDWYLSRYDPIRDPAGNIIGILYIGELERIYTDIRRNTVLSNTVVLLCVMIAAFVVISLLSQKTVGQIATLDRATKRFAAGDYAARARVRTSNEIGDLAASFNVMADRIEEDRRILLAQKAEIERINRNYLEMLSFVSHEFRNPIGSALLNVQLMLDGDCGELSAEQREVAELIAGNLRYLEEMTEGYLQLARIERGEFEAHPRIVRVVADIIDPVRRRLDGAARAKNMRIEVRVPDDLRCHADPDLIRVVYENLIGNAIKYGRVGGVIALEAHADGGRLELSVWNEGKPISPERLPHIFNKFQRYDVEESTGKSGTGLGLFIVKQIIEQHGGAIHAKSSEAEGTRFTFTLSPALES